MAGEGIGKEIEPKTGLKVSGPAGLDLFREGTGEISDLPAELGENKKLKEMALQRRELYLLTKRLFDLLNREGVDINTAIKTGKVDKSEMTRLYDGLTQFLLAEPNNGRIILYLPKEILPNCNVDEPNERLMMARDIFKTAYGEAWKRLLDESDIRALFIDGDVLEPGMPKAQRVRKAGHLIPQILEKGIIKPQEIEKILETTEDRELIQSVLEGVAVAGPWKEIEQWAQREEQNAAVLRAERTYQNPTEMNLEKPEFGKELAWQEELRIYLEQKRKVLEEEYLPDSAKFKSMSAARVRWEVKVKWMAIIDNAATIVADKLAKGEIGEQEINDLCKENGVALVGVKAIIKTGIDGGRAQAEKLLPILEEQFRNGPMEVKNAILSGLSYWEKLGLINKDVLERLGITLPDLRAPFPVEREKLVKDCLGELAIAAEKIGGDPQLGEYFYPVVLAVGSKVKGIGDLDADTDGAIFVRPKADWGKREEMMEMLLNKVPELKNVDRVLEFWVSERDGNLGLKPIPEGSKSVVGAAEVHFIMNGIWIGKAGEYEKLYGDLIKGYTDLSRFEEQKDEVIMYLSRRLEMDVLQARLMHKGFRKFYPPNKDLGANNSDLIDWKSDFWDTGYRQAASLLFISRVFLPDLSLR